jgi:hypothetical protein
MVNESAVIHTTTRLRVTICVLLGIDASSVAACVPGPLCADAQPDAKSFVEIPTIAEIDDARDGIGR